MPDQVAALLTQGLQRLETSFDRLGADIRTELSRLPDIYMPRRETEHRLDEHTIDIGELRNQIAQKMVRHDEDVKAIRASIEAIEARRKTEREADEQRRETYRRWVIGVAVPAILTLAGLAVAVLSLMARTAG